MRRINERVTVQLNDGFTMSCTIIKVFDGGTYLAQSGNDKGFITESHIITSKE